jgi:hypothetical protein
MPPFLEHLSFHTYMHLSRHIIPSEVEFALASHAGGSHLECVLVHAFYLIVQAFYCGDDGKD